jgi:transposase-like protein
MENRTEIQQRRASAEQRLQMIEQFRSSGLTRAGFCKQFEIPLPTLSYWLRKTKGNSKLSSPVLFSEVKLSPPEVIQPGAWNLEIVAPSGLTIRSRDRISIQDLAQLLR